MEPDSEIKLVRVQASGALGILNTHHFRNERRRTQGGHILLLFRSRTAHVPGHAGTASPGDNRRDTRLTNNTLTPMVDFSLMSPLF